MENVVSVFIQTVEKPARRVIVRRGEKAEDYWSYCQEVGCDVWGILMSMKSLCGEPVCCGSGEIPDAGTSRYVQGVEFAQGEEAQVPEGVDVIDLPAARYLQFQGDPFAEEDYWRAIEAVQTAMDRYDPSVIGCRWDEDSPRIQLEPRGERGYIELRAIR